MLADALISVLAIAGLSAAWAFGWTFMDPLVGLVGTVVIEAGRSACFVPRAACCSTPFPIRARAAYPHRSSSMATGCDLHVWQVGPGHVAVMVSIVSATPQAPAVYKRRLDGLAGLSHVTVEVHACPH